MAMSAGFAEPVAGMSCQRVPPGSRGIAGDVEGLRPAISVMIQPGQTALQRMPCLPWSTAIERVRPCTNDFDAL